MGATVNPNSFFETPLSVTPASYRSTALPAPIKGKRPNILHDYFTYNAIFTFGILTFTQVNDASYRNSGLDSTQIILRTDSAFPENRIETISGKFDYFIDDLRIVSVLGMDQRTKNTNANAISFKVIEPYSMGMFFQSIQAAAFKMGHTNFTVAPYLLSIEFFGHKGPEKLAERIPTTSKHIALRIMEISMTVTQQGCEYQVEAYPYNEQSYNKFYSSLPVDTVVRGKTVGELVKGGSQESKDKNLVHNINLRFIENWKKESAEGFEDVMHFWFPEDPSKKEDINEIFNSKLDFNQLKTTHPGMMNEGGSNGVYDPLKGINLPSKIKADPSLSEFKFKQGIDIITAINQIILLSDYPKKAISNPDQNGMIKWWRFVVNYEPFATSKEDLRRDGTPAVDIHFKIIPYKVHSSKFSDPNTSLKGKQYLKQDVIKEYDYVYTGKNVDIIDFNIKYDYSFYIPLKSDHSLAGGDIKSNAQNSNSVKSSLETKKRIPVIADPSKTESPQRQLRDKTSTSLSKGRAGPYDSYSSLAAKNLHDVVTDISAMMTVDMTILGDPFYLGDSGMGNYFAEPTDNKNINSDGTIDSFNGETDIIVNFKNPVDIDLSTGLYKFSSSEQANTKVVEKISGLYQIYTLESVFSKGKFTQTLKLVRRPGQVSDNPENEFINKPEDISDPAPISTNF